MDTEQIVESSTPEQESAEFRSSSPAGDQPTSRPEPQPDPEQNPAPAPNPIPAALRGLIEAEIERRFQSAKDRRWAQLEKQYGKLHEQSQEQDHLLPHEEAEEQTISPEARVLEQAEALLTRLGLRSSPQAEALLGDQDALKGPGGYLDVIDQVLEMILSQALDAEQQAASAAGVIAPSGGTVAKSDLDAGYQQRKALIRPGDVHALTALKREFREKGLNVF